MREVLPPEVFTVSEVARAAGASSEHVRALVAAGQIRVVPGTRFIPADEAVRIGRALRRAARHAPPPQKPELFSDADGPARRAGVPAIASSAVHGVLLTALLFFTALDLNGGSTEVQTNEPARLVFVVSPGPGGGGGGGGLRNPLPAPKVERKSPRSEPRRRVTVPAVTPVPTVTSARKEIEPPKKPTPAAAPLEPAPAPREPDPLPSTVLVAPVQPAAPDARDREGVIEKGKGNADSQGSGSGGGSGTGQGTGNGEGRGSGIGDGSGGGTGGGPYRAGSGIEPPRLLREVKADYTEEARRRSLSGDVVLEIVVRADGSVGDVRILKGLGAGLDQRAVAAVRQWRFAPAQRKGVPVDVVVEVAVEFVLR